MSPLRALCQALKNPNYTIYNNNNCIIRLRSSRRTIQFLQFKGPTTFTLNSQKVLRFQTGFVQQMLRHSSLCSRYFEKKHFRDWPLNSFMGSFSEKINVSVVENIILRNFSSIILFKIFLDWDHQEHHLCFYKL